MIYPSRAIEQSQCHPYRVLLGCEQFYRVYLDELGDIRQLPIGVALMVLTTLGQEQAVAEARYLLTRTQQEIASEAENYAIMEVVTTIMVYQFAQLSRVEMEAMLDMRLEETRVYREAKEEGREEGRQTEAVRLALRQLQRRLGQELPENLRAAIANLSLPALEELSEALLDFVTLADLKTWLGLNQ